MPRRGDNIYKRKDNRWEGRYPCGYHTNGKRKYRSVYGKSYTEVKEKLLIIQKQTSQSVCHTSLTVKILFDEWLLKISNQTKESTFTNYKMKIKKHLLPNFGHMRYDLLTAQAVHEFIQMKIKSGLSPKYVADILIVFKSMAKYVSREHGFHNPLANVSLPKASHKSDVQILNSDEERQLIKHLNANLNHTSLGVLVSLYTGLRIGELCALKWGDIDLRKRVLTVRRTIQRISCSEMGTSTKLIISEPKSRSSARSIPIPSCLMNLLKSFQMDNETFLLSGTVNPVEPRTMQYRFASILKKAKLPSVHFHSLRHLFATNCIKIGFDVKSLSEILGHSSVEITLNRYVHSSFEQKQVCMELLAMAV